MADTLVSEFFGITIEMFVNPDDGDLSAHFHAKYGTNAAVYLIDDASRAKGEMSSRAHGFIMEWARMRRSELFANWERIWENEPPELIEPLE